MANLTGLVDLSWDDALAHLERRIETLEQSAIEGLWTDASREAADALPAVLEELAYRMTVRDILKSRRPVVL